MHAFIAYIFIRNPTTVSLAQTAAPIEVPFGLWTRVRPRNHVLDGGPDLPREVGNFWWRTSLSPLQSIREYRRTLFGSWQQRCGLSLSVLQQLPLTTCLQSDWLPSVAELFRLPLPTPGTLFLNRPSQLLRCSHLSVI